MPTAHSPAPQSQHRPHPRAEAGTPVQPLDVDYPRYTWGDGLADQPLSDWWYAQSWQGVALDELIVFNPYLPRDDQSARQSLCLLLLRALSEQVLVLKDLCGESSEALLGQHRALSSIAFNDALSAHVPSAGNASMGGSLLRRLTGRKQTPPDPDDVLRVIAILDRCLSAAHRSDVIRHNLSLDDAVVASVYTSVNAAYYFEQFDWAQELLSLAAWLGHLRRGRSAYLPTFVAQTFADISSAQSGAAHDPMARLLIAVAHKLAGETAFEQRVKRVLRTGDALLVTPALAKSVTRLEGVLDAQLPRMA